MTVGTYRARNITHDHTIPSTALLAGVNTLKIYVVSGSCSTSAWLTSGYAIDAMDLIKTPHFTLPGKTGSLSINIKTIT